DAELNHRFGARQQSTDRPSEEPGDRYYAIQSYLDHQAGKLMGRFDADSYVTLSRALMDHDVRRGRSQDLRRALAGAGGSFLVAAAGSDRRPHHPAQGPPLADSLPAGTSFRKINSWAGHDGFLTEADQVAALIGELLAS